MDVFPKFQDCIIQVQKPLISENVDIRIYTYIIFIYIYIHIYIFIHIYILSILYTLYMEFLFESFKSR